jgi:hypothetical protein
MVYLGGDLLLRPFSREGRQQGHAKEENDDEK